METEIVIRTRKLTRCFGSRIVVDRLDFAVPRGSVVGLLGLNGAGKTTTIRMLLGLLAPTRGSCEVLGRDSRELTPADRARIGHTVEGHFLYPWMRVNDCERFGRETHAHWNRDLFHQSVSRFGIDPASRVAWLSRGQRAGVSIASTLAANPELLILDDPALGLDPVSRRALNETLIEFCSTGDRTVLLSTHLLDDVERIADRVALMVDGHMLVDSNLDDFRRRVRAWIVDVPTDQDWLRKIPRLIHSRSLGSRWHVTIADPDDNTEAAIRAATHTDIEPVEVSFEDIVLSYLSRTRRDQSFFRGVAS